MKYLRALQNAQINGPHGLQFVKGPEVSFDDRQLSEGEVIEVDDNFPVNEKVFEVVRRSGQFDQQGKPIYVPVESQKRGKPVAAGA